MAETNDATGNTPPKTSSERTIIQLQLTDFDSVSQLELPDPPVFDSWPASKAVINPATLPDEIAFETWPFLLYEDGIHLLGILHRKSLTVKRVAWAILHYQPDIIAIEASPRAVYQRHPCVLGVDDILANEVNFAAHATTSFNWLSITGIDPHPDAPTEKLGPIDKEIFTEWGLLEEDDEFDVDIYRSLSLQQLRDWRTETQKREPELYQEIISHRDDIMAGHLHALRESNQSETVVAAVGLQHLTGILDRLRNTEQIPQEYIELPPLKDLQIN